MDIDDYSDLYGNGPLPGLSLVAVPTPSLIHPSPPPVLLPSKPHLPSKLHMPSWGWEQSPTPFSFCGGALCITTGKSKLPSQENKNIISLNSDDEDEHLHLYTVGCHSPLLYPDPNLETHHTPWESNNNPSDSDSSLDLDQLYSTSSSTGFEHHCHGATAARSVSTQLTSAGELPGLSSSVARQSLSKPQHKTPADKFTDNIVQSTEQLLQGFQLKWSRREEKHNECNAKYGDQEKNCEYNWWLQESRIEETAKDHELQLQWSADHLKQLELELELEWMQWQQSGLTWCCITVAQITVPMFACFALNSMLCDRTILTHGFLAIQESEDLVKIWLNGSHTKMTTHWDSFLTFHFYYIY